MYDYLIGNTLEQARMLITDAFSVRPVRVDGQACIVTQDYRLDRINVEIENGVITKIRNLG